MSTKRLTHLDEAGRPRMVDVGAKPITERSATAEGVLVMDQRTIEILRGEAGPKGDPIIVAQLAGIQAAKMTHHLIPLCHPLPITGTELDIAIDESIPGLRATATARVRGKTGVEMEALTAVTIALLTAYDMLKAVDRGMQIEGIHLTRKRGGQSGDWDTDAP